MQVLARSLVVLLTLQTAQVESKLRRPIKDVSDEAHAKDLPRAVVVARDNRRLNNLVGLGGSPASKWIPLGECEGDCDNDSQCEAGLKCFQRGSNDPVPGCYGGESYSVGTDFCVQVGGGSNPSPTPPSVGGGGGGGSIGLCQGDCDNDNQCQGNLICHQRSRGDPSPEQCPNMPTNNQKDYCVHPGGGQPSPTHPSPTNPTPTHPSPTPPSPTPPVYTGQGYGPCGGDCDRDSDCKNGLICYQRDSGDPIPKGCSGNRQSRKDYCVDPHSLELNRDQVQAVGEADSSPLSPKFRLKMYWEQGYMWQDENFERKWCVMRDYKGKPGSGKCWYGLDVLPCNADHVYTAKCNNDERQQWQFEYVNDQEAIIKVPGEDRCLTRSGLLIVLRPCNSGNHYQRFFAIRGGLDEYRFELSQKTATRYCMNQAHHPKPGEVIAMYPCARTRHPTHMTSWWERYPL